MPFAYIASNKDTKHQYPGAGKPRFHRGGFAEEALRSA